ncbi:unnamed protein product [Symbiodinium natans]|uniref:Phospholipase/carboxylesterase/thioesterase domain-containing protein n=1 Tax=Symbiodinium natans TaxID=878477 RepID=A0A812T6M6_9DINO|nr:unnamed protein product [Symbiodinium natans]
MAEMLRVWRVSGEELVAMPSQELEEMADLGALKQHLQKNLRLAQVYAAELLHDGMIPALPRSKVVGDMDVVVFLLNVGADKDLTNGAHHPSCAACVGGSEPVVATLLQAGADSDIGAPLWIAHRAGNDLLVQVLLDHRDAAGVWLRRGWYENSQYDEQVEVALVELTALVRDNYRVDPARVSLIGSSMGAYASLELTARNPYLFRAAVLVAAHYDLEPMGPLVLKLAEQELPMWFIHAENDNVCPFEEIEVLVRKLRWYSRAEIRLTCYEDTWSGQGHCADRVAFWAYSWDPAVPACGEEVFTWLSGL